MAAREIEIKERKPEAGQNMRRSACLASDEAGHGGLSGDHVDLGGLHNMRARLAAT
jgi:hypothetical protein